MADDIITQAELQDYLGGAAGLIRASDRTNTAINAAAVASAIKDATTLVVQFATGAKASGFPWVTPPAGAKAVCKPLAAAILYEGVWSKIPKDREAAFAHAMSQLKALARGDVSWVETESPPAQNVAAADFVSGYETDVVDERRISLGKLDGAL